MPRVNRAPNNSYYVETYRPAHQLTHQDGPSRVRWRAHRGSTFNKDELHPSMTALFHVTGVYTQAEAIAKVLECAAGIHVPEVRNIVGAVKDVAALPPEG